MDVAVNLMGLLVDINGAIVMSISIGTTFCDCLIQSCVFFVLFCFVKYNFADGIAVKKRDNRLFLSSYIKLSRSFGIMNYRIRCSKNSLRPGIVLCLFLLFL